MSGYVSRILSTSVSGLNAQQAKIASASNNIANVNTEGYVKRNVELTVRESSDVNGLQVGGGVDISSLTRQTNDYLEKMLREANGEYQSCKIQDEYLDRIQSIFSLGDDSITTIGSALNDFFTAAGDLAVNPSNIELRANFISKADTLCSALESGFDTMSTLQNEADERIVNELVTVNSLTSQIAEMNAKIADTESSGEVAADARDKRTYLLDKLSEKLSFDVLEEPNGTINVTLSNGFSLVAGKDSYQLSATTNVSDGTEPNALDGGSLNYIVYDYSNGLGTEVADLTGLIAEGEGSLGGLLKIRGVYATEDSSSDSAFNGEGVLVEYASRIEAITRSLLKDVNTTYLGLNSKGQATSADLDGNTPDAFGLFTFDNAVDTDGDGVVTDTDLNQLMTDNNYANLSSMLKTAFSDPSKVAAARADDPEASVLEFSKGDGQNMEALVDEQLKTRSFSVGTFSSTNTSYGAAYDELVSTVGNAKSSSLVNVNAATGNLTTAQNQRDEQSAVSLDEEFVGLIQYQRAYEASARLLNIADELLTEVLNVL